MAIRGDRESGYFISMDGDGKQFQGTTRQCVHCQFTWEHKPGSGRRYGLCLSCNGIICANPFCRTEQKSRLEHVALHHPMMRNLHCIRFTDWNDLLAEEQLAIPGAKVIPGTSSISFKDTDLEGLEVTSSGILIKK